MKVEGNAGFTLYERGQIETATNNFNKAQIVGEGGQGTVYRAEIDGTIVAIKRCKEINESRKMDFAMSTTLTLSGYSVVAYNLRYPCFVYEFVQNRTLHELLDFQRSRSCHVTLGTRLRDCCRVCQCACTSSFITAPDTSRWRETGQHTTHRRIGCKGV